MILIPSPQCEHVVRFSSPCLVAPHSRPDWRFQRTFGFNISDLTEHCRTSWLTCGMLEKLFSLKTCLLSLLSFTTAKIYCRYKILLFIACLSPPSPPPLSGGIYNGQQNYWNIFFLPLHSSTLSSAVFSSCHESKPVF